MGSDKMHARHLAELGTIETWFKEEGVQVQVVERSEAVPMNVLLASLEDDAQGSGRYVNISFVPLEDGDLDELRLLQLYTTVPCEFDESRRPDVEKLLPVINETLVVGQFNIKGDGEIYFRYVHAVPANAAVDRQPFMALANLFVNLLELYAEAVGDLASGRLTLQEALARFE